MLSTSKYYPQGLYERIYYASSKENADLGWDAEKKSTQNAAIESHCLEEKKLQSRGGKENLNKEGKING